MVKKKRTTKRLMIIALYCLVLGAGNIIFGSIKADEYRAALLQAQAEFIQQEPAQTALPMLNPTVNMDIQDRYISRLNARLGFYQIVILGGRCILALGGIFLLLFLFVRWQESAKKIGP